MKQNKKPPWAKGLKRRGLYYEGLIDSGDLEGILEDHKRNTITCYGTRTSSNLTTTYTKPEITAVDIAEDDKGSGAVKNEVSQSKVASYVYL